MQTIIKRAASLFVGSLRTGVKPFAVNGFPARNMPHVNWMVGRRSFTSKVNTAELQEEVGEKILQILKSVPKCNLQKLTKTATFEELGFDSLDTVELIVAFEENLGVELTNEEAEKIQNVGDSISILTKYLAQKIQAKSEGAGNAGNAEPTKK